MEEATPPAYRESQDFQLDQIYWSSVRALRRGRPQEALDGLLDLERRGQCTTCNLRETAAAYVALEHADSAIATLELFVGTDEFDFVDDRETQLGDVLAELAGLYERVGRRDDARAAWTRLADRWADADEALQPRVRAARARATALAQDAG